MRTGRKAVALFTLISISVCLLCGCKIPFLWKREASKEIKETVSSYLDAFISGNRNISGTYVQGGTDPLNSIISSPVHGQISTAVKARMTYEIGEIVFDEDTGNADLTVTMSFPDVQGLYAADTAFTYDLDTFLADVASTDRMCDYSWKLMAVYSEKNNVWELFYGSCENLASDMKGFTGEGIIFREIADSEAFDVAVGYFTRVQSAAVLSNGMIEYSGYSNVNEYIREIIYGMEFDATYTSNDDNTKTVHLEVTAPSASELFDMALSSPEEIADYVSEIIIEDLDPSQEGNIEQAEDSLIYFVTGLLPEVGTMTFGMDIIVGIGPDGNLQIRNEDELGSWDAPYFDFPTFFTDEAYDAAISRLIEQGRLPAEDYGYIVDPSSQQDGPDTPLNRLPSDIPAPEFAGDMTVVEGDSNNVFTYEFLDSTGTSVSDFYTADDHIVFHIQTNEFYTAGTVFYYKVFFNGEPQEGFRTFTVTEDFSDSVTSEYVREGGLEAGQYIIVVFDPGADTVMATACVEV